MKFVKLNISGWPNIKYKIDFDTILELSEPNLISNGNS